MTSYLPERGDVGKAPIDERKVPSRLIRLKETDGTWVCNMLARDIVDSHIHLFPRAELQSLAWCKEGHPLYGQHSIEEYLEATKGLSRVSDQKVQGFIFIETDRKSHLDNEAGWDEPLRELDWIKRIADGTPQIGEGHEPQDAHLCLGVVLWAPLPSGVDVVKRYVDKVKERASSTWQLVRGFRYLIQNKPRGVMLTDSFIDALRWMGRNGFTFDLGVDARSGGHWQLNEAVEMITRAHEGLSEDDKVKLVISKNPSDNVVPKRRDQHGSLAVEPFNDWKVAMAKLASFPKTYVKISGGLSEIDPLPPQAEQGALDSDARAELLQKTGSWVGNWLKETLTIFGPRRVMFGSDWPVCNIGGGGNNVGWINWWSVTNDFMKDNMNTEKQADFWSGNAMRAYGVDSPPVAR
ncbi:MAG: hypothetical protein Q9181_003802 [Wetmoreana brouardii]